MCLAVAGFVADLKGHAVDHGFPEGSTGGDVVVHLDNKDGELHIRVINDGITLDPDFELNNATGLGLSIVRTLVTTELAGRISMRSGVADDFIAVGLTDNAHATGTVVDLTVPV